LRFSRNAKRKEHSAKREDGGFFVHEFFAFYVLGFAVRIKQFELVERARFPLFDHRIG
jgi:hypothetical protein